MPTKKLDIVMISRHYPPIVGGVSSHVKYLSDELSKITARGSSQRLCKVHVFTAMLHGKGYHAEGKPPHLVIHRLPADRSHFLPHGEVPFGNLFLSLSGKFNDLKPDLIHAQDFESLYIGLMLKTAFRIPLIMTTHRTPKEWDASVPRRSEKDCFMSLANDTGLIDKIVAPSVAYKNGLIDQGFREDRIEVILHGVPVKDLKRRQRSTNYEVFGRFGIRSDDIIILCPTRVDAHKDPETFIQAAQRVKETAGEMGDRCRFVISGAVSESYKSRAMPDFG